MTKKSQKGKNTKALQKIAPSDPENAVSDVAEPLSKENQFIQNLFRFSTIKEAATEAGYSESTVASTIYTKMKKPHFRDKIRQYAINHDIMTLPRMLRVEDQLLDYLEKNPVEVSKHARIWAQKKKIAGILKEEEPAPVVKTVNIGELRVWMQQFAPDHGQKSKDIKEGEVITINDEVSNDKED